MHGRRLLLVGIALLGALACGTPQDAPPPNVAVVPVGPVAPPPTLPPPPPTAPVSPPLAAAPTTLAGTIGRNMLPRSGANVDRFVKYQVQGRWPFAAGRAFEVGSDPQQPAADGFSGGTWRGSSGSIFRGQVRVIAATPTGGTLDMDVSTTNPNGDTAGALKGSVNVVVCP